MGGETQSPGYKRKFDAKRCPAATLRLRAANIAKLAEPGHRREDRKEVYPGRERGAAWKHDHKRRDCYRRWCRS